MPRQRFSADEAVCDGEWLLYKVVKVLKAVFEPPHSRERERHVDPNLEEAVSERHLDVALIRQPPGTHDVADLPVHVEHVAGTRLEQTALAAQIEIFSGIYARQPELSQQAQPVKIISRHRIFNPEYAMSCALKGAQRIDGLLGGPGLVGVDHHGSAAARRLV